MAGRNGGERGCGLFQKLAELGLFIGVVYLFDASKSADLRCDIIEVIARHACGQYAVFSKKGAVMTENQRDYLADLALKKGVRFSDTSGWSAAKASEEIERLKAMPDAEFEDLTEEQSEAVSRKVRAVLVELGKWGFERGRV